MKKYYCLTLLIIQIVALILPLSNLSAAAVTINPCPPEMVIVPGGSFKMGADNSSLERSIKNVAVNSFCIDRYEVTNAQFTKFVEATKYTTVAELPLSKEEFPELSDEERLPGSLVFLQPKGGVQQVEFLSWWHWIPGANWQHPFGPDSTIVGKEDYPVVHIAYQDAIAYAKWAGKLIPTEAQWEYAARGGLDGATYAWGNRYSETKANTWQGKFPFFNTKADGHLGLAKVGSFPANGYGLYDMAGNVWEWTSDWFGVEPHKAHGLNHVANKSSDTKTNTVIAPHVIKGGSYLCAPNYCSSYRPSARQSESPDTGTNHIGFRLIKHPVYQTVNASRSATDALL